MNIDPRHLLMLLRVAECGSITQAADRLALTQPALTKILRSFESRLGVKLLERSSRGTVVTAKGKSLLGYARSIEAELKRATSEANALRGKAGATLRVGCAPVGAAKVVPLAISELLEAREDVRFEVLSGELPVLLAELAGGNLDVVVGQLDRSMEDQHVEDVLYYDTLSIIARSDHPLARRKGITLLDLAKEQWVLPPKKTPLRKQIDNAFLRLDVEPPAAQVETGSVLISRSLLLEGNRLTALPAELLSAEIELGLLTHLKINLRTTVRPVGLILRRGMAVSPAVEQFIQCAHRVAEKSGLQTTSTTTRRRNRR